ncbi:hypothetical protein J6590_080267 [Homalodisca vitripennis]|nr:hypothetical protein J6590_080267 [Homalodisca vitripennis]
MYAVSVQGTCHRTVNTHHTCGVPAFRSSIKKKVHDLTVPNFEVAMGKTAIEAAQKSHCGAATRRRRPPGPEVYPRPTPTMGGVFVLCSYCIRHTKCTAVSVTKKVSRSKIRETTSIVLT